MRDFDENSITDAVLQRLGVQTTSIIAVLGAASLPVGRQTLSLSSSLSSSDGGIREGEGVIVPRVMMDDNDDNDGTLLLLLLERRLRLGPDVCLMRRCRTSGRWRGGLRRRG